MRVFIGNAPLVNDARSYHMGVERIKQEEYNDATQQYEVKSVSEMYNVTWLDNGYSDVYDMETRTLLCVRQIPGSLLGTLTARGNEIAN